MNKKLFVWAIILLLFQLPACAFAPEEEIEPVVTFTPIAQMSTATETPLPTQTGTPASTLAPTQTQVPTLETATPTLSSFSTPAASYDPVPESLSPSGRWLVWRLDCKNPQQDVCLQFSDRDSAQKWYIAEEDIKIRLDLPYTFSLHAVYWPDDYRWMYLATTPKNFAMRFPQVNGVIRFSLANGTSSYVVEPGYLGNKGPILYSIGFSNDDQSLAYAAHNGDQLDFVILDLYSGDRAGFSVPVKEDHPFGDLSWSPDDDFLVFSTIENSMGLESADIFSVFLVTLEDFSSKQIFEQEGVVLENPVWISDTQVEYTVEDGSIVINIETGEITEVATGVGNE